jgi:hypothetical protein
VPPIGFGVLGDPRLAVRSTDADTKDRRSRVDWAGIEFGRQWTRGDLVPRGFESVTTTLGWLVGSVPLV